MSETINTEGLDISELVLINKFKKTRYYIDNSFVDQTYDLPIESNNGEYILFYENYEDTKLKTNLYIFDLKSKIPSLKLIAKTNLDFNIRNALWIDTKEILVQTNELNYFMISF